MQGQHSFNEILETPQAAKEYILLFKEHSAGYLMPHDINEITEDDCIDLAADLLNMVMSDLHTSDFLRNTNRLN